METDLIYAIGQLQFALKHVSNANIVKDCLQRTTDAIERLEENVSIKDDDMDDFFNEYDEANDRAELPRGCS